MKKIIILLLIFYTSFSFSQQDTIAQGPFTQNRLAEEAVDKRDITYNEISLGAFNLIAFGAVDITYERILTPNTSVALEGFILAWNKESSWAYSKESSLTGKYKYFFEDNHAWGLYANGFMMLSSGTYDEEEEAEIVTEEDYTDLAIGFGGGYKFMVRQGFFADLGAGIGRNLFSNNSPTIVAQFTVNVGFRF